MKKDIIENYFFRIIISAISFLIIGIFFILLSTRCANEVMKALCSTSGAAFVISGVYNVLYEAIIRKGMIATVVEKVNLKRSIDETETMVPDTVTLMRTLHKSSTKSYIYTLFS